MTTKLHESTMINGLNFFTTIDGVRIAYRMDGPAGKPVLMLANSIATTMHMWDGQIADLSEHFLVLRYDYRGHGESDTPEVPYSFDRLGRDVIELLDSLHIKARAFPWAIVRRCGRTMACDPRSGADRPARPKQYVLLSGTG